ncbi:hypothetical protein GYMLUDRAFT_314046 [Collybiopsis luxurians FD-317 M1]|nr:hypothetical protein GYMLUDRAFT_314046 [Collybiopsis luxurians FD-317 M1]
MYLSRLLGRKAYLNCCSSESMPTSTLPFEILFDLANDTGSDIVFEPASEVPYTSGGAAPSILLGKGRHVSLVLDAGSTYYYTLRSSKKSWQIS